MESDIASTTMNRVVDATRRIFDSKILRVGIMYVLVGTFAIFAVMAMRDLEAAAAVRHLGVSFLSFALYIKLMRGPRPEAGPHEGTRTAGNDGSDDQSNAPVVVKSGMVIIEVANPGSAAVDLVFWLPAMSNALPSSEQLLGRLVRSRRNAGAITPDNFAENEQFAERLHELLARELPTRPALQAAARRQVTGTLAVIDQRVLDAPREGPGTEPLPEDIIGVLQSKHGWIVAESYRRNPAHRLLTAKGLFRIDYALQQRLVSEIRAHQAFREAGDITTDRVM